METRRNNWCHVDCLISLLRSRSSLSHQFLTLHLQRLMATFNGLEFYFDCLFSLYFYEINCLKFLIIPKKKSNFNAS